MRGRTVGLAPLRSQDGQEVHDVTKGQGGCVRGQRLSCCTGGSGSLDTLGLCLALRFSPDRSRPSSSSSAGLLSEFVSTPPPPSPPPPFSVSLSVSLPVSLFLSVSVCLSVCLCLCLSLSLSLSLLLSLSLYLPMSLSRVCLSVLGKKTNARGFDIANNWNQF